MLKVTVNNDLKMPSCLAGGLGRPPEQLKFEQLKSGQ
jgi:hypothetical protein